MERIYNIIRAEDFNMELRELLIDLYSKNYKKYFEELYFNESEIDKLTQEERDRLTKLAAVVEYVGNRQPDAVLYDLVYSEKLKLDEPYVPGAEKGTIYYIKRILSAPREFSTRNVFYDPETIKPV